MLIAGLTIRHTRQNLRPMRKKGPTKVKNEKKGPKNYKIKAKDPSKRNLLPKYPKGPWDHENLNPCLTVIPKCTATPKMRKRGYTILHILFSSLLMVKGDDAFSFKIVWIFS